MARPKKRTVDYFPHVCSHKKTLFILEQKFQNNGYAFWFKILEMLGNTEGHYVDCNNASTWEFLQAKTLLDENKCIEILELLSKLEAIDSKLWKKKIIWCDKFIEGIADVYKNRKVEIPSKPSFYRRKPRQDGVSTGKSTQTKLKETKLNETKVEESKDVLTDLIYSELLYKKALKLNIPKEIIDRQNTAGCLEEDIDSALDHFASKVGSIQENKKFEDYKHFGGYCLRAKANRQSIKKTELRDL